jgi:hypothetical protein
MNEEVLERLLIDRALGALAPDVESLLTDYLAARPQASGEAAELERVVRQSAAALKQPGRVIPLPRKLQTARWVGNALRFRQRLALAASFVVGAALAAVLLEANRSGSGQSAAHIAQRPAPAAVRTQPLVLEGQAASLPFWSNQRALLLVAASQHPGNLPASN